MIKGEFAISRTNKLIELNADLIVTGGGLSGVCTALVAARQGMKVILVQDRPVLGGNASSEVRLWILGATSHMGNNNRWAREGGIVDEILVENTYKNPEGNPVIFDVILLDKIKSEKNITLLLNTAVSGLTKSDPHTIESLFAFCSQNSTEYLLKSKLFCDASGDGVVGFLSGAPFRIGAESRDEFNEAFAPSVSYGELLGHSLYFYTKDTGKPVKYHAPAFALDDIKKIPRFKSFNTQEYGCNLWWIEFGGRLDTVYDTECIKWELWKVVYGVWNYIKNSGKFPDADPLTLEWVGMIPGKRESRRFEGDYLISQRDVVEQREHSDAVAYGGWSIDLHPADGVFSDQPGCNQWHSKGLYQIPFRCLYSRSIKNLFLTGRLISATHVAFGSTRVMATAAYLGQVIGYASKLATEKNLLPAQITEDENIILLQKALIANGHYIPGLKVIENADLVQSAQISASSELTLFSLAGENLLKPLETSCAQLLPVTEGEISQFIAYFESSEATYIDVELRVSSKSGNFTPDVTVDKKRYNLNPGKNKITIDFDGSIKRMSYVFVCFLKNPAVYLNYSSKRITGILSVFNTINKKVSNYGKQSPPSDIGIDEFEFWCPQRRPEGLNIALDIPAGLKAFKAANVSNGVDRPVNQPNAWVADFNDLNPELYITWSEHKKISKIRVSFDTDFDHPMESVLMSHPETRMPFCISQYKILDDQSNILFEKTDNYQTINEIIFNSPIITQKLILQVQHPSKDVPAAVFSVRCYE